MGNLLGIFRQEEQDDRPPTPPIYSGYHQSFRTSKTSDKTFRIADPRQLSTSCEQVLDVTGGDLKLLNATLFVHPFSVDEPVHMSVKEMDYTSKRRLQILTAGYNEIMRPGMHLCLQPHGLRFLHPVTLELTNTDFYSHVKILVFQKEIYPAGEGDTEPNIEADWTDVTDEYSPEIKDNNVVLTIGSFSLLETIKVVIPALSLGIVAGIAIGYRLRACALLNDHLAPCNFYVYYKLNDPFLTVFAEAQHSGGDWKHKTLIQSQHVLVGHGSSNYSLMDEEMLLFYYDTCQKLVGAFPLKLKKCKENGQHFQVPICARSIEDLPACFYIRRRLSDVIPEQDLCEIQLKIHPNPSMESTWQKLIRIQRVFVMQHLDVLDILPQLRQDNIINVRQQEELLAFPAKETQAGKLLDIIGTKDFTAFKSFIEAMKDHYPFITNVLEEVEKPPPSSSPGLDDHKTVKSMSSTNDNSVVANMPQKESGKSNCASYQPIKRPCVDVEKIKQPMRRVEEPQKPFEKCTSASGHFINGTDSGSKKTIQAKRLSEDEDAEKMPTLKKD